MAKPSYDVPAVRHAIRLLEVLGDSRQPLGVSEITRAIGSNKNMIYRLLSTLQDEGWVAAEEPGPVYRMTLVPFEVASRPLATMDLRTAAQPPMRELWEELGESTYLGILDDDAVLYIEHLDSRRNVRIAGRVGGRYPLHCTAPGKLLLAHAGTKQRARTIANGLQCFTENTLCDPDELAADLETIHQRGWALDNEEYGRGLLCFAAPIRDHSNDVVGAVGISVTTIAHTVQGLTDELGPKIIATANAISRRMGTNES
jgi:DNA-binding IclR family transcriptional regulator